MKTVEMIYRFGDDAGLVRARPADADAARFRLDDGNRAFAALFSQVETGSDAARCIIPISEQDFGLTGADAGALSQHPYAAVLGCADARVPVELIFNEGPNDLFVVRVAGNTLGDDVRRQPEVRVGASRRRPQTHRRARPQPVPGGDRAC